MKRTAAVLAAAALLPLCAAAQSRNFTLGKWIEIQTAILQELNRSYVDTLPVQRMGEAGVDAMLDALDPYTVYVPESENEDFEMMIGKTYGGIGAIIYKPEKDGDVLINEPYEGSPAAKAGLQCGDAIVKIDGQTVHGLTASQSSERMKGKPGTKVVFEVRKVRSGQIVEVPIVRERIHIPDIEYCGLLADGTTGYMRVSGFTEGLGADVRRHFTELKAKGMRKFVLDLRGNGGGLMGEAIEIVSLFVPRGSVVVTSKGNAQVGEQVFRTSGEPVDLQMPLVILVDSGSASSSEIVTGALQDLDRATVMGTRTFGKGLVQGIRPLPYNGQLKITTAKYYTPSGRCVQAIDYSHRNEDGSVGHIPDSLTHEFRTAHGRIVRDGGGITPDVELQGRKYSRLTYSLVYNGVVEHFVLDFVTRHDSIPPAKEFHLSEEEWEAFLTFAEKEKFDWRSSARTLYDQMRKELSEDGMEEGMKAELDALQKALDIDKKSAVRARKEELIPIIEREVAIRYRFQSAGVEIDIRYDDLLARALESPLIEVK